MCLGTVAKVVEVIDEGRAVVEHGAVKGGAVKGGAVKGGAAQGGAADGARRREEVLTMTIGDDIGPGDWVVIHSGFVLERISEARALDALAIRNSSAASAAPQHKEMAP